MPTREQYLLDLVLSDLTEVSTVLPELADHRLVLIKVVPPPLAVDTTSRLCWMWARATWVEAVVKVAADPARSDH